MLFVSRKAFCVVFLLQLQSQFGQDGFKSSFRSPSFCFFFFPHFFTDVRCVVLKELFYSFVVFSWVVVSDPAAHKSDFDCRSIESVEFTCGK